ncbi:MAG: hypothetical protein EOO10_01215 [Chitinophagaceae bacterium]|nr:MAG: hypothetical protein EOO10_01215 [Chitinophagaceae bacterium]
MENNQHSIGERNTSTNKEDSFRNEQPGQQLPSNGRIEKMNTEPLTQNEQHSESSLPEKDNETLGTP